MSKSTYLDQIKYGKSGSAKGIENGLGSMNKHIHYTQQSRYYLLGGESGSGKTTLGDFAFILSPFHALKTEEFSHLKMSVNYWSLEQSRFTKESKWASHFIKTEFGVYIPPALALGKLKTLLTKEQEEFCFKANEHLEELLDAVNIIDSPSGPSDIEAYLIRYGNMKGKWITYKKLDSNGNPKLNKMKKPIFGISGWIPNDPNERHIFFIDHIAYANLEKKSLKENIDYISRLFVKFRELTHSWTFVVIQQFNTELASVERQKFKKSALAPQRMDFGDSRYTFQDADVVWGILNPYKYDILDSYQGYQDIARFEGLAIWAFLIKNRHDGGADKSIPYLMDPVALTFEEIPDPEETKVLVEMGSMEDPLIEFYEKAETISNLNNLYI